MNPGFAGFDSYMILRAPHLTFCKTGDILAPTPQKVVVKVK